MPGGHPASSWSSVPKRRRKPVPYEPIPPSLARMLCADWWCRKLWQMRWVSVAGGVKVRRSARQQESLTVCQLRSRDPPVNAKAAPQIAGVLPLA